MDTDAGAHVQDRGTRKKPSDDESCHAAHSHSHTDGLAPYCHACTHLAEKARIASWIGCLPLAASLPSLVKSAAPSVCEHIAVWHA